MAGPAKGRRDSSALSLADAPVPPHSVEAEQAVLGGLLGLACASPVRADEIPAEYRKCVTDGLKFMVSQQQPDGHWEAFGGQYPITMTALGGSDDNKQVVFNLKSEELTVNSGYTHAALSVTVANGTTNILGAVALAMRPRFGPANDDDLASVAEIVT